VGVVFEDEGFEVWVNCLGIRVLGCGFSVRVLGCGSSGWD
jgi:hypothetical protein